MNIYDHRHCIFCGQSSDVEDLACRSLNNYLNPDTVGNRPHAYLTAGEAKQVNATMRVLKERRDAATQLEQGGTEVR